MSSFVRARQAPLPACLLLPGLLLAGCAGSTAPPPPRQVAGDPHYACPDGRGFSTQFDTTTHQKDLFLDGAGGHRLDPVPDPIGGVLYQDADFQLRPGPTDAAFILTDRSTTLRQTCARVR